MEVGYVIFSRCVVTKLSSFPCPSEFPLFLRCRETTAQPGEGFENSGSTRVEDSPYHVPDRQYLLRMGTSARQGIAPIGEGTLALGR